MKKEKLILLEFNELCPDLIHDYIQQGFLPNFKRLRDTSSVRTTDARASGELLNPWVQWVTVHTGMPFEAHGVERLNEMSGLNGKFIWDTLSEHGLTSWICGSMNAGYAEGFNGAFLPDPWSESVASYPAGRFDAYVDYVGSAVRGHSSGTNTSSLDFLKFLLRSGISIRTLAMAARQLVSERLDTTLKWRRASVLDWIQFDVFEHVFKQELPDFSTFFINSTAHFQHHYWERMANSPGDASANPVLFGYRNMDKLLGRAMRLAQQYKATIVFCTGLSQQAYRAEHADDERHYYHLNDESVLEKLGVTEPYKFVPVMAEQFHLEFDSAAVAQAMAEKMKSLKMDSGDYFHEGDDTLFLVTTNGKKVYGQCRCTRPVHAEARIVNPESGQQMLFSEYFYHMADTKSGMHNPIGMFWVQDHPEQPCIEQSPVELEAVYRYCMNSFSARMTGNL